MKVFGNGHKLRGVTRVRYSVTDADGDTMTTIVTPPASPVQISYDGTVDEPAFMVRPVTA